MYSISYPFLFKSQWEKASSPIMEWEEKQPIKHSRKSCSVWLKSDKLSLFAALHLELSSFELTRLSKKKKRFWGSSIYLKVDTDHKGVQPPQKNTEKQVPEICCTPQCLQLILRYSAPKNSLRVDLIWSIFTNKKRGGAEKREFKETLEGIDVFVTLTMVMVTRVYTCPNFHQIAYMNCMQVLYTSIFFY